MAELLADGLSTTAAARRLALSYQRVVGLVRQIGFKLPGTGDNVGRIRAYMRAVREAGAS